MFGFGPETPGIRQMGIGLAWVAGSAFAFLLTYTLPIPIIFLFVGAAITGVINFVLGVYVFIRYRIAVIQFNSQHKKQENMKLALNALIESMVSMSIADGVLSPEESELIADIHQQVTDITLGKKEIKRIAARIRKEGFSIEDSLAKVRKKITPEIKELIFGASVKVMLADLSVDRKETKRLVDIAHGLGMHDSEYAEVLSTLEETIEEGDAEDSTST